MENPEECGVALPIVFNYLNDDLLKRPSRKFRLPLSNMRGLWRWRSKYEFLSVTSKVSPSEMERQENFSLNISRPLLKTLASAIAGEKFINFLGKSETRRISDRSRYLCLFFPPLIAPMNIKGRARSEMLLFDTLLNYNFRTGLGMVS